MVQSFYRALKKAPSTHKLGALYVIDSVVRQWIEKAKAAGQDLHIEGRGEPGTYPAAVKRVTELMPALFEDIIKGIPTEQKPKLENMITIWERGNTFPANMLADFKKRLNGEVVQPSTSTPTASGAPAAPSVVQVAPKPTRPIMTPVGYPPRYMYDQGLAAPLSGNGASAATQQSVSHAPAAVPATTMAPKTDVNDILAALSKAAPPAPSQYLPPPQASASTPAPSATAQLPPGIAALFSQQAAAPPAPHQFAPSAPPQFNFPPPQAGNPAYPAPPQFAGFAPQPPSSIPQNYPVAAPPQQAYPPQQSDPLAPLRGLLPENILNDTQKLIPALQLLQDLQKHGIPPEQWAPVLKGFEEQYQPPANPAFAGQPAFGRPQDRDRSRSPDRSGGRGGRGSPVYGSYDHGGPGPQADDEQNGRNNGGRSRFRQRSPVPSRDNVSSVAMNGKPMQPKVITYDQSLPRGCIKVLSRTLFVGGANGSQQEIQDLFERFGQVQTCISNRDKRHAFVKMTTRQYALNAKSSMEDMQTRNEREVMNVARQTKWGVGFGPRECCDYARGESVIPIDKLTDADTKWLLTAEYGGTGGRPIEPGMVLEEPDIEIGAGVSSKAMSKRVGPDMAGHGRRQREDRGGGGRHGRNKGGDHGHGGGGGGGGGHAFGGQQGMESYNYARPEPVAVATPPAVPGFGFSLGLPQGNGQGYNR